MIDVWLSAEILHNPNALPKAVFADAELVLLSIMLEDRRNRQGETRLHHMTLRCMVSSPQVSDGTYTQPGGSLSAR